MEGLACADPGARTPIGASGNFFFNIVKAYTFYEINENRDNRKVKGNQENKSPENHLILYLMQKKSI
jgi:hypothetical protein